MGAGISNQELELEELGTVNGGAIGLQLGPSSNSQAPLARLRSRLA